MTTWEKVQDTASLKPQSRIQWKFVIGGLVIVAAIAFLIISQTSLGAQYFITVEELLSSSKYVGQTVRISGAVVGETINYDAKNLIIQFSIAHVPQEGDNQGEALYQAANNPNALKLPIRIENQVKPDLLKHEAQAILTGKLGSDGVFHATEILLKCPSRFQDADANSVIATPGK